MYSISKLFEFSASHQLYNLPDSHPCARLHGHNYVVKVELSGTLDARGFVLDYGDLSCVRLLIEQILDHRHLNDVLEQPTAENLAHWLFIHLIDRLPLLSAVSVSETPKTWATYRL